MSPVKKKAKKTVTPSYYTSSSTDSSDDESDCGHNKSKRCQLSSSSSSSSNASPNLSARTHKVLTTLRGRTNDVFVEGNRCLKEFHDYVLTFDAASDPDSEGFLCQMGIMVESSTQILKQQMKATQFHMKNLVDSCIEVQQTSEQQQGGNENPGELKSSRRKKKQKKVLESLPVNVDKVAGPSDQIDEIESQLVDPVIPHFPPQPDLSSFQQMVTSSTEVGSNINKEIENKENLAQQQQPNTNSLDVLSDSNHLQNLTQSGQSQVVDSQSMDSPMETEDTHAEHQFNSNGITEAMADFSGEATTTITTEVVDLNMTNKIVQRQCMKVPYNIRKIHERRKRIEKVMPTLTVATDESLTTSTLNNDDPPKLRPSIRQRRNTHNELIIGNNSNEMDVAPPYLAMNENDFDDPGRENQEPVSVEDVDMIEVSRQVVTPPTHLQDMCVPDHQSMQEVTCSVEPGNIITTPLRLQSQSSNLSVSITAEDAVLFHELIQSMEAEYNQMVTSTQSKMTIMKTLDQLKSTLTNKYNVQFTSTNNYEYSANTSQNSEPATSQTSYQGSIHVASSSQEERLESSLEEIRARVGLFMQQQCSTPTTPASRQTREVDSNLFKERMTTLKERIIKAYRYYPLAASHTPDFIGRVKQFIDEMAKRFRNEDEVIFEINKYEDQFLYAAAQEVEDSQEYLHSQSSSVEHSSNNIINLDDEYNCLSGSPSSFSAKSPFNSTVDGILTEEMDYGEISNSMNFLSQFSCSSFGSTSSIWDHVIMRDGKTWVPLYKILSRLKARNRMDLVRYFFATICLLNSGNIELYHEPSEQSEHPKKGLMLENDIIYVCIKKSQSCRTNFEQTLDSKMNNCGGSGRGSNPKNSTKTSR